MTADSRDEAIREAKRYVCDVVRNDWSFEFSTKPGAPPPTYPLSPEPNEVLEWRLREYDSSGSELEPQFSPPVSPRPGDRSESRLTGGLASSSSSSSAEVRRTERRRKRRRQLEEEMSWNEGLRTWVERRDAWSGARSKAQVKLWEQRNHQSASSGDGDGQDDTSADADADAQSIPASTTSHPIAVPATGESSNLLSRTEALNIDEQPEPQAQSQTLSSAAAAIPRTTSTSPSTSETPTSTSTTPPAGNPPDFTDPLIPIVPSLIAKTNPIRASITPTMYPSIYSKVVIQGLTPTVPINLADMTKAMVQGWKADGQWPPKPTSIVLPDNATVRANNRQQQKHPDTPAIPDTNNKDKAPSSPESKRKSGIASTVRKVLHFSGFHPHPFHRRGSSSQHQPPQPDEMPTAGAGEGPSTVINNAEHGGK